MALLADFIKNWPLGFSAIGAKLYSRGEGNASTELHDWEKGRGKGKSQYHKA